MKKSTARLGIFVAIAFLFISTYSLFIVPLLNILNPPNIGELIPFIDTFLLSFIIFPPLYIKIFFDIKSNNATADESKESGDSFVRAFRVELFKFTICCLAFLFLTLIHFSSDRLNFSLFFGEPLLSLFFSFTFLLSWGGTAVSSIPSPILWFLIISLILLFIAAVFLGISGFFKLNVMLAKYAQNEYFSKASKWFLFGVSIFYFLAYLIFWLGQMIYSHLDLAIRYFGFSVTMAAVGVYLFLAFRKILESKGTAPSLQKSDN